MPTKAYQIHPASCEGKISVDDISKGDHDGNPAIATEEKLDDVRYLLQIRPQGSSSNYLTSRRISKVTGEFVEKQDKLPHIRDFPFPDWLVDTVIDGGIHGEGISSDTVHEIALGNGSYTCWDVLDRVS